MQAGFSVDEGWTQPQTKFFVVVVMKKKQWGQASNFENASMHIFDMLQWETFYICTSIDRAVGLSYVLLRLHYLENINFLFVLLERAFLPTHMVSRGLYWTGQWYSRTVIWGTKLWKLVS